MAMIGATELIIILIVLLFLLGGAVGVGVLIYVLAVRGKSKGAAPAGVPSPAPYQPMAPPAAPAPQPAPSPAASGPVVRMLAASDYAFAKIELSMRQCDLALQGVSGPQAAAGEPGSAVFSDGKHTVRYTYDAAHGLRMLEISGPNAKYVRNDILNIAYMPSLEGYKVSGLLGSSNPAEVMQGILAAEFIGIAGDQKYYINPVANLLQHPDARVRQEAQRVHGILTSR